MSAAPDGRSRPLYLDPNLLVVFAVTLMAVMGVASIAPALPPIMHALGLTRHEVAWLITAFTLPGIFLTPVAGALADHYGRKRILVPSLLLFAVAGTSCAVAQSFPALLVLRIFQGLGASALGTLNATILGDLYEGRERAAAMGYNGSVLSLGTAVYPALGGAMALIGWRWPFTLSLLAIPVAFAAARALNSPAPHHEMTVREYLHGTWKIIATRQAAGIFLAGVFTFIMLYGALLTYLPLLLEHRFGSTSFQIGLLITFMSFFTALASSLSGRLSERWGKKKLILVSFACFIAAQTLIPNLPAFLLYLLPSAFFGTAMGLNMPIMLTLLAELAPMNRRGAVMAINGTVLRLGQTLGPLILGIVLSRSLEDTFYVGAATGVVGLICVGFMLSDTPSA